MKKNITILAFLVSFFAFADTFDVSSIYFVRLEESTHDVKKMKIDDALVIMLPKERQFLQGFEVEVKIPSEIMSLRNNIFYAFYTDISPSPEEMTTTFTGKHQVSSTLPSRLSLIFRIPFGDYKFAESPYVQNLSSLLDNNSPFVFFRIYMDDPELKAMVEDLRLDVSVKTILSQEGLLALNVIYPDKIEKPITLTVNENQVKLSDFPLLLPVGKYHLSIVSDFFRSEVRSFIIDRAKTTNLTIALTDISPQLHFQLPESTSVVLNGKPLVLNKPFFTVTPGEHTILFRLGSYELTRTITADLGKNYAISLSVDSSVTEIP
ncbi:MAG: hypothetical protein ACRC4W_05970 [Treponemataceae bacterium]